METTENQQVTRKTNKNGSFRYELENGFVLVKSTKKEYKTFVLMDAHKHRPDIYAKNESVTILAKTSKGTFEAEKLALQNVRPETFAKSFYGIVLG